MNRLKHSIHCFFKKLIYVCIVIIMLTLYIGAKWPCCNIDYNFEHSFIVNNIYPKIISSKYIFKLSKTYTEMTKNEPEKKNKIS